MNSQDDDRGISISRSVTTFGDGTNALLRWLAIAGLLVVAAIVGALEVLLMIL